MTRHEPARCPETSDGYHCGHWQDGAGTCCGCGADGRTCPDCGRLDCDGDDDDPPGRQP